MNILILGSGGREYMLAWKIRKSKTVKNLFIAPGNGGTSELGENIELDWKNLDACIQFIKSNLIHMVVIGPEMPLVEGFVDQLKNVPDLNELMIIGPEKAAAKLEGSKAFAKSFMKKNHIPTASYKTFTRSEVDLAVNHIRSQAGPYVLKADGLAGGKGVLILSEPEEAVKEAQSILDGKFGEAGHTLVIESFLEGLEFSVFALCFGTDYMLLPVAKDYKRIGEGDSGLNTGGMGSVSPVPGISNSILQKVEDQILQPTLNGLIEEGITYSGFLFLGLILVDEEPFVIEYNCRLGDPETQVVLPRIDSDLVELLRACATNNLAESQIKVSSKTAVCTVLASEGYPVNYEKGKEIRIQRPDSDTIYAHAGTVKKNGKLLTSGGRVLGCIGLNENPTGAKNKSQIAAASVQFEGKYYRSDIGSDLNI
ncbi:MAG TPA: phosphoribosylamine--glycine ligase [Bacteroidales bacterium]|nr:phosphoribosylamine--glycine ligase [Bacteroidales bacterium]